MAPKRRTAENPHGLAAFLSDSVIIATGGPGELYRDSVYPRHCFGSLGLALEAGIEAVNLTESQFGIGTPRDNFPWNLSGTYVQCMPYIFSRDTRGNERNFLADYYRTTQELASNIFRKGLPMAVPCDANARLRVEFCSISRCFARPRRVEKSSWTSTAIPFLSPGDTEFSLDRLDDDVRAYLANSGALLAEPIDRLRKMNPLSIELYKRYKYDITRDPLEFAINNQHMNGGLAVDTWGATNLEGCYAVGEVGGNAWRDPARRRRTQCRPGVRHALRRAYRRETKASREVGAERVLIEEAVANTLRLASSEQHVEGCRNPKGRTGPNERSCRHPLQCRGREGRRRCGARPERDDPPARASPSTARTKRCGLFSGARARSLRKRF